jgi:hypothetical protein
MFGVKLIHLNGSCFMLETPASPAPGRDNYPGRMASWPEWMDDPAYLAARAEDEDLDLRADPEDEPPPDVDEAELAAEAGEILAAQERLATVLARLGLGGALAAGTAEGYGRRGPGTTTPS